MENFYTHTPQFLQSDKADELFAYCLNLLDPTTPGPKILEYPIRGQKLKRSPKHEWKLNQNVGVYWWGQERRAYYDERYVTVGFPPILEWVRTQLGDPGINHCIVIAYTDGVKHHIKWHSDKQEGVVGAGARDIVAGTNIYNVVVCDNPRRFQLARLVGKDVQYVVFDQELTHGSLFTLAALGNKTFKHQVPKEKGWTGTRFSLVFRTIKGEEKQIRNKRRRRNLRTD